MIKFIENINDYEEVYENLKPKDFQNGYAFAGVHVPEEENGFLTLVYVPKIPSFCQYATFKVSREFVRENRNKLLEKEKVKDIMLATINENADNMGNIPNVFFDDKSFCRKYLEIAKANSEKYIASIKTEKKDKSL